MGLRLVTETAHEAYTSKTLPRTVVHAQMHAYQSRSRDTIQYNSYDLMARRQS